MLKWYEFQNVKTGGSVICKGHMEHEARKEAEERLNCAGADLVCIGHAPFHSFRLQQNKTASEWSR